MIDDFVGESPASGFTGTGTYSLNGAAAPFTKRFRDGKHGATGSTWLYYVRTTSDQPEANGAKYEKCIGTLTWGSPDLLTRDYVLESSNSNAAVSWLSTDVFIIYPAAASEALAALIQYDVAQGTTTPTLALKDIGSVNHHNVTAASRTANLPAGGSTLGRFYRVGFNAYGHASNYVAVTPNGTDTISGVNAAVNVVGRTGTKFFRWSPTMSDWVLE